MEAVESWAEREIPVLVRMYGAEIEESGGVFVAIVPEDGKYNIEIEVSDGVIGASYMRVAKVHAAGARLSIIEALRKEGIIIFSSRERFIDEEGQDNEN